jgi:hypothetical protein
VGCYCDALAELAGAGASLRGTVSAVTGLARITALPGVGGVVEVGFGLLPQANTNATPTESAMRSERIVSGA